MNKLIRAVIGGVIAVALAFVVLPADAATSFTVNPVPAVGVTL
jgi:hypothetical protein